MNKIKELVKKYKSLIIYGLFGILTGAVNFACHFICTLCFGMNDMVASVIAWVVAVLFAFVTNRKWVFHSKEDTAGGITTELAKFASGRAVTELIELAMLAVLVEMLHYNALVVKLAANVLVVILNYVFSKVFVFKSKP